MGESKDLSFWNVVWQETLAWLFPHGDPNGNTHHAWPPIPSFIVWLTISSHPAKKQRDFARKHKVLVLIRGTLFFCQKRKTKEIKRHNPRYGPSTGSVEARTAVAKHVSVPGGEVLQASPQSHPQKLNDSYIFVSFGQFLLDPMWSRTIPRLN